MKKLACFFFTVILSATVFSQPRQLNKIMELKMPKTEDDYNNGVKGASVCWNPTEKKYYAAFSGSKDFPLGVYDSTGKLLTDTSLTAMQDIRGLWYNVATKKLCGNTGNDGGWFSYILNSKGTPVKIKTEISGMKQPDENSAGAYEQATGLVCFFNKGKISFYNNKGEFAKKTAIHFGQPKVLGPGEFENEDNENTEYNQTTVICTGVSSSPVGLLNAKRNRVELYDIEQGYLQQILLLPDDEFYSSRYLGFAYTNEIYWLYNINNRSWIGFK